MNPEASGSLGLGDALFHRLDELFSEVQRICAHASTIPGAPSMQSAVRALWPSMPSHSALSILEMCCAPCLSEQDPIEINTSRAESNSLAATYAVRRPNPSNGRGQGQNRRLSQIDSYVQLRNLQALPPSRLRCSKAPIASVGNGLEK